VVAVIGPGDRTRRPRTPPSRTSVVAIAVADHAAREGREAIGLGDRFARLAESG
jgi:hypothetical protein